MAGPCVTGGVHGGWGLHGKEGHAWQGACVGDFVWQRGYE